MSPDPVLIRYQTSGECPANVVKTITALNCPCPATIDICQGDPLCTTSTSPATDPYRLIFYLTDVNGIIQAISTTYTPPGTPVTNQFTGVPAGDGYKVYILSYYNGFFPYDVVPTVGSSITANLGDNSPCYNPDFLSDYYCYNVKPQPYAEPTAADLCRSTVAGSTVTLFGNPSAANTFAWAIAGAGTTGATAANLTTPAAQDLILDYTNLTEGTLHLTYTISHTLTPTCEKVYDVYVVINNLAANPTDAIVCQGAVSAIVPGLPTGGVGIDKTHNWVITSPGTTGASSGNLSNTNTNTVTVATAALTPGVITLAYTYTDISSGCTVTEAATVTIRPTPVLTLTTPGTVCESAATVIFTATPAPTMPATGSFTTTAPAGFTDNGNGTATLNPALAGDGTYTVTYNYNDGFGCTNTIVRSITIAPNPVPTITDPADVCVNGAALNFTGSPNVPTAGTFTTAAAGLVDNGNGTATLNPATAGAGTYTVTYTFTDAAGCQGTAASSVTIFPTADASFAIADFCYPGPGLAAAPTTLSGTHEYAIINPLNDGAFANDATGVITDGVPNTTYTVQHTITTGNGCKTTATDLVKVNQLPVVNLNDPIDECYNSTFNMEFVASPVAGTFAISPATAAFVPNNAAGTAVLDPNTATAGTTYTITYSYTDAITGCSNSIAQEVYVIPQMDATFTMSAFCIAANGDDGPANPATITGVTGGVFSFDERPVDLTTAIDPVTGQILNAVIGVTYKVLYTAPNGCDTYSRDVPCTSCCNPNAGDQSSTPAIGNICPLNTGLSGAETVSVQVAFGGILPATGYAYLFYITDANGIIKQIATATTYNAATPADFTEVINLAAGLSAGTYYIRGLNYNPTDPDLVANGGTIALPIVGADIDAFVANLSENDGTATDPAGIVCGDINMTDNVPFIVNNVRCTDITPWNGN